MQTPHGPHTPTLPHMSRHVPLRRELGNPPSDPKHAAGMSQQAEGGDSALPASPPLPPPSSHHVSARAALCVFSLRFRSEGRPDSAPAPRRGGGAGSGGGKAREDGENMLAQEPPRWAQMEAESIPRSSRNSLLPRSLRFHPIRDQRSRNQSDQSCPG